MTEIVACCPLCGSTHSKLFDRRRFRGQAVENRLCEACGLVYQSPRMSGPELDTFYEREYRQLYQGGEGPNPKDLGTQRGRAAALLDLIKPDLEQVRRHLDIGCSAGLLLQAFQDAYGCQPIGIEPGAAYREYARRQDLQVYASLDELQAGGEPRFDLISLAHVLEHLPDPVPYMASLRENLLQPDGRLLVEVPNLYAHDSFEVAHLVSYSPHTLAQAVQQAGFELLALHRHGQPRSAILPLYLTLLARPEAKRNSQQGPIPEKGVKFKRQIGILRRRVLSRLYPKKAWLKISDQGLGTSDPEPALRH